MSKKSRKQEYIWSLLKYKQNAHIIIKYDLKLKIYLDRHWKNQSWHSTESVKDIKGYYFWYNLQTDEGLFHPQGCKKITVLRLFY